MSKKDYIVLKGKGDGLITGLVKKDFIKSLKKPVKKKKMSKKGMQALKELEKDMEPVDEVFK